MTRALLARRVVWVAYCALLIAVLLYALQRLDLARLMDALRMVRAWWIVLALVCCAAQLPLWAWQWTILAHQSARNTFLRMLGVIAITSATNNTAVLLLGEATSVVLLVTRIGMERAAALAVLAMDQLLVGVTKLLVLATAATLLDLPEWMKRGVAGLGLGVTLLLLATLVLAWRYAAIAERIDATLPPWAVNALRSVGAALAPVRSPSRAFAVFAIALAKKVVDVLVVVCVQRAFGVDLPVGVSVMVVAALGIATMVPIAPASVGIYEGTVAVVYSRYGIPAEQAVAMALVQHACYLAAVALPGYGWLLAATSRSAARSRRHSHDGGHQ